ncbi:MULTISPECIES: nuclear transport factor 2 family protein [unclassified Streptomyces]|uniref:nuclear transport factor 2 family protein n=1 Tax=unclassified Streptomyces TaxID=2593676 RepID=UPI002E77F99B|nr:nuclear transport factor 2 family protein [Streptomyces sp. JV176]MEE1797689.1 nuclear transport factor 2 family protein [Streptomyces sp. JV176]
MPTTGQTEATERNREIVRRLYDGVISGDLSALAALRSPDYRVTQAPGHPVPGTWTGDDAGVAGGRVFAALGIEGLTVQEIVADGPHLVIGLVELHGTDAGGAPWTMPVAEYFHLEDGLITDIRPYYWDLVEVRRIAGHRAEAAHES